MNILALDTFAGISGDMFLGMLVDLGVDLCAIEAELKKLPLEGYRLVCQREKRQAIEGVKITVEIDEKQPHRNWADIDKMLDECDLEPEVKDLSRRIFLRIGKAEAKIHGVALEQVHFHEVGAVDSIVDIVGAAIGLKLLNVDKVFCPPLPLSSGTVQCAHGSYPLPAPATLEILEGLPVRHDSSDKELVTPTGAAIAAEIALFAPMPSMTIEKTGYGAGTRHLEDRPNLLRGTLGKSEEKGQMQTDKVAVLETHIDDANPECLGALMEDLLANGALDVAYAPLQMKKNRPGVKVTVIASPDQKACLARQILLESSATGVRCFETERFKLRRETRKISTNLGEAKIKLIFDGDQLIRITPEYEDCRSLAATSGKPLSEVYRLVQHMADSIFLVPDN